MHILVEFYTDDHGVVIPQRVHFGARQIDGVETLDRWYGADYCYIKLKAPDNNVYIIRMDETRDQWLLTMFQRGHVERLRPNTRV
jgi:hypothetical protein